MSEIMHDIAATRWKTQSTGTSFKRPVLHVILIVLVVLAFLVLLLLPGFPVSRQRHERTMFMISVHALGSGCRVCVCLSCVWLGVSCVRVCAESYVCVMCVCVVCYVSHVWRAVKCACSECSCLFVACVMCVVGACSECVWRPCVCVC